MSWSDNFSGECGHKSSNRILLLPRRVEVLTGVRARSASTGGGHNLVVTEESALYSFGFNFDGQLGHGSSV